jgi:hypothetical protein
MADFRYKWLDAVEASPASANARHLANVLIRHYVFQGKDTCWPGYRKLSELMNRVKDTVKAGFDELEELGFIESEQQPNGLPYLRRIRIPDEGTVLTNRTVRKRETVLANRTVRQTSEESLQNGKRPIQHPPPSYSLGQNYLKKLLTVEEEEEITKTSYLVREPPKDDSTGETREREAVVNGESAHDQRSDGVTPNGDASTPETTNGWKSWAERCRDFQKGKDPDAHTRALHEGWTDPTWSREESWLYQAVVNAEEVAA